MLDRFVEFWVELGMKYIYIYIYILCVLFCVMYGADNSVNQKLGGPNNVIVSSMILQTVSSTY